MARIKLPHEALGTFIRAANSWLGSTLDAKTGLEVRFANVDGDLNVSVGADSNYIEATLKTDAGDLDALTAPIFLDVPSLAAYDFDSAGLTMVVPAQEKDDQRITFSVPGFNMRIPRKKGEIWKRNFFDMRKEEIKGLTLDTKMFNDVWRYMSLPNSFKTERRDFQISIDVDPGLGFIVHGYDGLGALCHTYAKDGLEAPAGRMTFIESFFNPCKAFEVESEITFATNDRQCFGLFKSDSTGIKDLRWTQPRHNKHVGDIPKALDQQRKAVSANLTLNPKEMKSNVNRVCMLLKDTEMRSTPVEFSVVGDNYAMMTRKSNGEGEVKTEGMLAEASTANLALNIQAACLKDYLSEFELSKPVRMEVLKSTVVLMQDLEGIELLYWMPVMPRIGSN